MNRRWITQYAGMALVAVSTACVDSPSAPLEAVDASPLATSFETLAQEMAAVDLERSEELRWAALAVRAGVMPGTLELTNNGVPEVYDAFVHAVSWISPTQALRPATHRNVVGWRRSGGLLQVLLVGLARDSAPVLHPFSMRPGAPMSPLAGAKAAYFERGNNAPGTWLGIGGFAKVEEKSATGACGGGDGNRPAGVGCQLMKFEVRLNILFAPTRSRDSREVAPDAVTRRVLAPEQDVPGVKLVFSCAAPAASGCN